MAVEDWLRDTETEPPCGPNLEYDEQFMALATAAAGKPEQQFGETIIPAEEPDWKAVLEQSAALLSRTKDLRTTLLLTRALTREQGLSGFAQGVELTRRLLETRWDDVHPRLVVDGEPDPMIRTNALTALADEAGLLRDVRLASLITTPVGPITVRTAEAVLKRDASAAEGMTEAQLAQAVKAGINGTQPTLAAIPTALEHWRAIESIVTERMGPLDAPNLERTRSLLETVVRLVQPAKGNGEAQDMAAATTATVEASDGVGVLRSRQDALRALDAVCDFLSRSEPSNPAPLLIRRAQRLIGSDFLDIMRDIAPESLAQIEAIAGIKGSASSSGEETA